MALRWTRDIPAVRDMPGTFTLDIYDDQYASSSSEFDVEPPGFELEVAEKTTGLSPTECAVFVVEDSPGQFADIFGAEEGRFKLIITYQGSTYYEGYALPDFYGDSPNAVVSSTELVFSDMAWWDGRYYTPTGDNGGLLTRISNDTEELPDVVGKCLDVVNATGSFHVASNWYAHDISNPFQDYHIDEAVFRDENDDPRTIFEVLDHVARSLGLLVRQKGGEFYFEQLREKSKSTYPLQPFTFDSSGSTAGTEDSSYSNTYTLSNFQETRRFRQFESPAREAAASYDYGGLGGELLRNSGFTQWNSKREPASWNSLNTSYTARADSPDSPDRFLWIGGVEGGASKIDAIEYDQEVVLPPTKQQRLLLSWRVRYPNADYLQGLILGAPYDMDFAGAKVQIGSHYLQEGTVNINSIVEQKKDVITYDIDAISGSSSGEVLMPEGAVLQNTFSFGLETLDEDRDEKGLELERPLRVGDTRLVATIQGEYDETDFENSSLPYWYWDTTSNYIDLGGLIHQFVREEIETHLVAPDGTPVSGQLSVVLRTPWTEGKAALPMANHAEVTELSLDLSGPTSDGITWIARDEDVRGEERESEATLLGTGPTEDHPGAIRIPDGSGGHELAGDWKVGAYSGGSPSGDTLEQLRALEELKLYIEPRERPNIRLDQDSGSPIDPTGVIYDSDTGDRYLIAGGTLAPARGRYDVRLLNLKFGTTSSLEYDTGGAGVVSSGVVATSGRGVVSNESFSRRTSEGMGVTVLTSLLEEGVAVKSIDINPIGEQIFDSGNTLILQSLSSARLYEVTLTATQQASDDSLTIESFTPGENILPGSQIYRGGFDLNSYISKTDHAIQLFAAENRVAELAADVNGRVSSLPVREIETPLIQGEHYRVLDLDTAETYEVVVSATTGTGAASVPIQEQIVQAPEGSAIITPKAWQQASLTVQPDLIRSMVTEERKGRSIGLLRSSVSGTVTNLPLEDLGVAIEDNDEIQVLNIEFVRGGNGIRLPQITVVDFTADGTTSASGSNVDVSVDSKNLSEPLPAGSPVRVKETTMRSEIIQNASAITLRVTKSGLLSEFTVQAGSITAETNIFKDDDWDGAVDQDGKITSFASVASWAFTGAGHAEINTGSTAFRVDASGFTFLLGSDGEISNTGDDWDITDSGFNVATNPEFKEGRAYTITDISSGDRYSGWWSTNGVVTFRAYQGAKLLLKAGGELVLEAGGIGDEIVLGDVDNNWVRLPIELQLEDVPLGDQGDGKTVYQDANGFLKLST